MFHPLLGSLKDIELDELISKSTDLTQKYQQAMRNGNAALANQVRMVLFTYQEEYRRRMAEIADKAKNDVRLKDKVQIKK